MDGIYVCLHENDFGVDENWIQKIEQNLTRFNDLYFTNDVAISGDPVKSKTEMKSALTEANSENTKISKGFKQASDEKIKQLRKN